MTPPPTIQDLDDMIEALKTLPGPDAEAAEARPVYAPRRADATGEAPPRLIRSAVPAYGPCGV